MRGRIKNSLRNPISRRRLKTLRDSKEGRRGIKVNG